MGFYKNFGKNGFGADGRPNVDPAVLQLEEAGYLIEILHISSGKMAVFPSWLTDFTDNYTSNWNSETIFGRNDPVGSFQGTTRSISVGLSIPSYSVIEARENMHQLEHLIANLYPSYKTYGGAKAMHASPLVKVKFANLIKNANVVDNAVDVSEGGLSGWMTNVNFTPNLEAGFHHPSPSMGNKDQAAYNGVHQGGTHSNASHTFIPKVLDVQFTLNVVHEHMLGWEGQSWLASKTDSFPYGIETLSGGQHKKDEKPGATTRTKGKIAKAMVNKVFRGKSSI